MKLIQESGGVGPGQSMAFVGEVLPNGTNVMVFEDANGVSHSIRAEADAHFVKDFFAIWLGNIGSDKRLGEVKQGICSGNTH